MATARSPLARPASENKVLFAAWLIAAIALGGVLALALPRVPPIVVTMLPFVFVTAFVLLPIVTYRPTWVLIAAFASLPIVRIEPAPYDLLMLALMAFGSMRRPFARMHVPPSMRIALWGLALITLVSMINTTQPGRALQFAFVTLFLIASAAWLSGMFERADLTRVLVRSYILAAAVSSVIAVLALKAHLPGLGFMVYQNSRAQGLFKDPNVFGPFLVPAAAILLEEIARPRLLGYSARRLFLLLGACSSGVVFSFSRAAWGNLVIAFLGIVFFYLWRRQGIRPLVRALIVLAVSGALAFGLLAVTDSLGFLGQRAKTEQHYDKERFGAQNEAIDRMTEKALGHGPGSSEADLKYSTHSSYVRVVFEQGLFGAAMLVLLITGTLVVGLSAAMRDSQLHGIGSAALVSSWAGLSLNGIFVDTLHWRHLWVLAPLIWACALIGTRGEAEPGSDHRSDPIPDYSR